MGLLTYAESLPASIGTSLEFLDYVWQRLKRKMIADYTDFFCLPQAYIPNSAATISVSPRTRDDYVGTEPDVNSMVPDVLRSRNYHKNLH